MESMSNERIVRKVYRIDLEGLSKKFPLETKPRYKEAVNKADDKDE